MLFLPIINALSNDKTFPSDSIHIHALQYCIYRYKLFLPKIHAFSIDKTSVYYRNNCVFFLQVFYRKYVRFLPTEMRFLPENTYVFFLQVFHAFQFIYEEYYLSKYELAPLKVVGFEGEMNGQR